MSTTVIQAAAQRRNPPAPALEMRARAAMVSWTPRGMDAMWAFALAAEFDRLLQKDDS